MNGIRGSFEPIQFTEQEKMDLTARLARAAEQEESMTDAAKRKVKKISRGMIVGIAAVCLLTAGALAAVLAPGLGSYFSADTPGAQEALKNGIYRIDKSQTYKGWTVTLAECVGDDNGVYIWVDVTAPKGTVLAAPCDGEIVSKFEMDVPEGIHVILGSNLQSLPDEEPTDNRISFCVESWGDNLRGERVDITLHPILDMWVENPGTDRAVRHEGELTAAIRDHQWVFEGVLLDYPDQTIRLTPNIEVPYMDGTAALSKVEISPIGSIIRIEGGSCYDHHGNKARQEAADAKKESDVVISGGGVTITMEQPNEPAPAPQPRCWDALTVWLNMADGSVLSPAKTGGGSCCWDGLNAEYHPNEVPYVELRVEYGEYGVGIPPRAIDPGQVATVTVCGVEIPVE